MKGHYFLKWLFLTVLSVSVLHFREAGLTGRYQIERISNGRSLSQKSVFHYQHYKPSNNQPAQFAHFKNAQSEVLLQISFALSRLAAELLRHSDKPASGQQSRLQVQNQHFHSRSRSGDEHSIFHS